MEVMGQLTRRRALVVAVVLLAVLALGGKLLLGVGANTPGSGAGVAAGAAAGTVAARTAAGVSLAAPLSSRAAAALAAAEAPPLLVVHVVGAVRRPGVYRLPEGARAIDALARAGGATARADLEAIPLAAPLADGQQVVVPRRGEAGAVSAPSLSGAGTAARSGPVSLSTASVEELDTLPGVGPATAQRIVDYRAEHGPFSSVDDLDAVSGIGMAKVDQLRDLVVP
jgi:competence protein ComEA